VEDKPNNGPRSEECSMGIFDKAKNSAEKVAGQAKEAIGDHTDDSELKAEGQRDQAKGSIKNVGEDVKEAASDIKKDLS
jgi:uncharacterized protein YjbJ (UPF0337 family)